MSVFTTILAHAQLQIVWPFYWKDRLKDRLQESFTHKEILVWEDNMFFCRKKSHYVILMYEVNPFLPSNDKASQHPCLCNLVELVQITREKVLFLKIHSGKYLESIFYRWGMRILLGIIYRCTGVMWKYTVVFNLPITYL